MKDHTRTTPSPMAALRALPALLLAVLLLAGCSHPAGSAGEAPSDRGFERRKALLLEQVAERYTPTQWDDRGKYTFPPAIARMELHGRADAQAQAWITEYEDGRYGFFHFPFIGMARILCGYGDAPEAARLRDEFLRAILLHDPGDHFNALTSEGTENHIAMARTSGYLFAQEAAAVPGLGQVSAEWRALLKPWLLQWARRIYQYGTGEWDSSVYAAYTIAGWLNLYDFAEDEQVRAAARAVLDYHAATIALKYTQGAYGGAESRGMEYYGMHPGAATEYLGWLWFGPDRPEPQEPFFHGDEYIQAVHAATSSYRPPAGLLALARKQVATPSLYRLAKPDYLLLQAGLSHETFLIARAFTLGTVQAPLGGWTNASYGIINWKLATRAADGRPAVVLGNGGMKSTEHARGRNPFDQFLQHRSTVVQMTRVPHDAHQLEETIAALVRQWQADYARDHDFRWSTPNPYAFGPIETAKGSLADAPLSLVYFPRGTPVEIVRGVAFLACDETYLAVRPLARPEPELRDGALVDAAPAGEVAGFVVEAANAADHGSLQSFKDAVLAVGRLRRDPQDTLKFHYTTLAGETLSFRYATSGTWQEMIFDWGYGITEQQVGFNTAAWKQPVWPAGEGQGRIPEAWVDGQPLAAAPAGAIIDGPDLQLAGNVLTVRRDNRPVYSVDYSGLEPRFSAPPARAR